MTKTPPVNDYDRALEAELELERALDVLTSKSAELMRESMEAEASGQREKAEALDKEYDALRAEIRALRLQG